MSEDLVEELVSHLEEMMTLIDETEPATSPAKKFRSRLEDLIDVLHNVDDEE